MQKNSHLLPHVAACIYNTPLMITETKLNSIMAVLGMRIGAEGLEPQAGFRAADREESGSQMAIAVIPVFGSLVYRNRGFSGWSGMRSYTKIRADFQEALDSREVDAILFDIDSHGGEVAGVFDLADEIFQARGQKPIYAIANENAFSAAYAIASAADQVFLPRTGGVGSIGVIAVHTNQRGFNEKVGVEYTPIYAGAHKNDFSPHNPLSDQARKVAQEGVDAVYEIFVETVARNRGLAAEAVRKTEARTYDAEGAVTQGLADAVKNFREVIEYISANASQKGGRSMFGKSLKQKVEGVFNQASEEEVNKVLAGMGYVPKASQSQGEPVNVEAIKTGAAAEAKEEFKAYVKDVHGLCSLAGMPQESATFIEAETPLEKVKEQLVELKAQAEGKEEIISTVSGMSDGEPNPLLADARKRAAGKQ